MVSDSVATVVLSGIVSSAPIPRDGRAASCGTWKRGKIRRASGDSPIRSGERIGGMSIQLQIYRWYNQPCYVVQT